MCEAKPGCRCAGDTRGAAVSTLERYSTAHPDGPSVDPLTAASTTYTPANPADYIAEADSQVLAAESEVAAAQAQWTEARHAANESGAKAMAVYTSARDLRAEGAVHEAEARDHGQAVLARTRDLYLQNGVNPRLVGYYISDMRDASGLSAALSGGPEARTQAFLNGRALAVKVKRNGPDAEATRAASEAAKNDPDFQAAMDAFQDSKAKTVEKHAEADSLIRDSRAELDGARAAEREATQREDQVVRAQGNLEKAQTAAKRARARAKVGAPMEGRQERMDYEIRMDIYSDSDGRTNLWLHQPGTDGGSESYEPVRVVRAPGSRFAELESASGKRVAASTHYANYRSSRTAPEVWVGPPAAGTLPARELHGHIVLERSIDSGD